MTQVWVVKYDEGMYLFKDVDTAEQSIKDMYKGEEVTFEREEVSDSAFSVTVLSGDDRMQDKVNIIAFDVHESPTVIHRYVTEIDRPVPRRPKREEF